MASNSHEIELDEVDEGEGDGYQSDHDDKEEVDSHPLGNPAPPPDVDLELLRGDRIGDTAYSGKWCIEIVMKLMQSNAVVKESQDGDGGEGTSRTGVVDMDEDLQNQIGALWDMTANEEVCTYLHSIGAVESICFVIGNSCCPRATEMCVGMLGNIITHDVMWQTLHNDSTIYSILVPLLANEDQPTLLEVTRFFNTALCHREHSHCYASLFEGAGMVLQELARILCGSTHGELLTHTAELVQNLMDLDEEDSKFCAVLAEQDFVLACVEASKELGYEQVSMGQNSIMQIFYRFTTYQAGIGALENCLEQLALASSSYLRHLCQNLSLSNHCGVITTTLATLNHVFCRSVSVRTAIMTSPRLIGYILKVLVTVYTRLGLYSTISTSGTGHAGSRVKDRSRWSELEDTPTKTGPVDGGSWSERAIAASGSSSLVPTPEASPLTRHETKELDISWSERRVGTPLANQYMDQVWKRPQGTPRVGKKKDREVQESPSAGEQSKEHDVLMEDMQPEANHTATDTQVTSTEDGGLQSKESDAKLDSVGQLDASAGKIDFSARFGDDSSRRSGGFLPGANIEDEEKQRNEENFSGDTETKSEEKSVSDIPALTDGMGSEAKVKDRTAVSTAHFDDSSEDEDSNQREESQTNTFEETADSMMAGEDKYHTLLSTIREFGTDLLNSLKEPGLASETGAPQEGKELMMYWEKHCNRTELRALVKCVADGEGSTPVLEKLLLLCEQSNTSRLEQTVRAVWDLRDKENHAGHDK